jgi:2-polyprenyl-3-methyl-5-hydroxy-6-metoxy-1,4-benzoquinol methylase
LLKANLAANPRSASNWLALADVLLRLGAASDAEALLIQATSQVPDSEKVWGALASISLGHGKYNQGLFASYRSIALHPTPEAKRCFAACLNHVKIKEHDPALQDALARALKEAWGPPAPIAEQATNLLGFDPVVSGCVDRANQTWPRRLRAEELFGTDDLQALSLNRLLITLLTTALVCPPAWGRFLTRARHALLEMAPPKDADGQEEGLPFFAALAQQCFISEYIYSQSADESAKVERLLSALTEAIAKRAPVSARDLVTLACYVPLGTLRECERLTKLCWPSPIQQLFAQQIDEPKQEETLAACLPTLTKVTDEISQQVRGQYEESPYPRWVTLSDGRPAQPINGVLGNLFPHSRFRKLKEKSRFDILVAGSGTGQHPISTARRFSDAEVLAVDLSRRSLAYGQRKAQELGVNNLEFGQADILEIGSLNRQFDVIESMGVLHHMQDPWGGWRTLIPLLNPGGLMKLGFYSRIARENINRLRDYIRKQGFGSSPSDIRQNRESLILACEQQGLGNVLLTRDFYSTSGCRDLLFHVQEHQLTLPEIKEFIDRNGLVFLGFEIDGNTLARYLKEFPDDVAATNLSHWHEFEKKNPDTFVSMYQFWVQKQG